MIYGIFGVPGSGKSYLVFSEYILKNISTHTVISNIKINDSIELTNNYVYLDKFAMDLLNKNISEIMSDEKTSHDDKKLLLNTLFDSYKNDKNTSLLLVVDEAHLYGYAGRAGTISYIDGFLSIHRHIFKSLSFDVLLITQVSSRLNTLISEQIEESIYCVPSSQRLIPSVFEYVYYGSVSSMKSKNKDMVSGRKFIVSNKDVFNIYTSGFSQKGTSGFRKKIYSILVVMAIVLFFTFNSFSSLVDGSSLQDDHSSVSLLSSQNSNQDNNDSNSTFIDYKIVCISVPNSFDVSNVDDYLYTVFRRNTKTICYKNYKDKKHV